MAYLRCRLRPGVNEAIALQELRELGLSEESVIEDVSGAIQIFGALPDHQIASLDRPPFVFLINEVTPFDPTIDWERQWATSGADYREGHVFLNVSKDRSIRLKPGPGFGDLSHPTTRLVIELMRNHVSGREVVDFGSGSGVLSLAAAALGATTVLGVEIDPQAVLHAQENALINGLQDLVTFVDPSDVDLTLNGQAVYLMNMIPAEQDQLIEGLGLTKPLVGTWFVSGILLEDRDRYLSTARARGLHLIEERTEAGWIALHLQS